MINLLLNIVTYQNNNKNYDIFFTMHYDVYYYLVKFQLQTLHMHGEMKKNYIREVI